MTTAQTKKWIKWNLSFTGLNQIQVEWFNKMISDLKLNMEKTTWEQYIENTKGTTNICYS